MEPKGKILVVEDRENWRMLLQKLLAKDGFAVAVAASFHEAKDALRQQMFDFAVVDIRLSEDLSDDARQMEETLHEIRKYGDDTPVVVLSAYGTPRLATDAILKFGVVEFMEKKDFVPQQFLSLVHTRVQNALERRSSNPPRFHMSSIKHIAFDTLVKELAPHVDATFAVREIGKFLNELLRDALPLSPEGIKSFMISTTPRLAAFWCWSRKYGKAVVGELRDYEETEELLRPQLAVKWHVVTIKSGSWSAIDIRGTVYTLDNMAFHEFLARMNEISV